MLMKVVEQTTNRIISGMEEMLSDVVSFEHFLFLFFKLKQAANGKKFRE